MATSFSIRPSNDAMATETAPMLSARAILAVLSAVFLGLALVRIAQGRKASHPAIRTWLIIGVIFGVVSAWLWFQTP
jgi:DMSO reductase anchor subunit